MQTKSSQTIILVLVSLAAFMATLDTSIVNIALPTIAASFHADIGLISWVVLAYLLVLSGLMLACGKIGDLYGFRRVFIAGFVLFTFGSLLCGLAASLNQLIAFRVVQAIGAAAIEAIAPAMITCYLPAEKRGWALGIMMTIVSVAIAAGPVLGGYLTEFWGWNWIFFINVPVGVVAVVLAARFLPADSPPVSSERFDTYGAVLILAALATLLFPLNQGLYLGWTSPLVLGSFALSILLFAAFIFRERRTPAPLIDLSLFSSRNYRWGNVAGMLIVLAFAGSEFLMPFYFELVRGFSTEVTGLLLAIPAVTLIISGPIAGRVADRYGSRGLMAVSSLGAATTFLLFTRFDTGTDLAFLAVALAIEGFFMGLFVAPNMSLILGSGSREGGDGVASGVMMTLRNVGAVLGVAIFGTVAVQVIISSASGTLRETPSAALLIPGFHAAFLAGMVVCLAVLVISLSIRENRNGSSPT
jgi:EmrB/QacA subfamily drug resistance transporter